MSTHFKLALVRMQCLNEQHLEPGQDEMRLFGFAISRKGHLFATGFKSLGGWSTGDVRDTGIFPMVLCETDLEDDGLEVLLYLWLVEEDSGGVRNAAAGLETSFRDAYREKAKQLLAIRFPRDCIPFTAFYKAVIPFQSEIEEASTDGVNNDELYTPVDILLDKIGPGLGIQPGMLGGVIGGGLNYVQEISFERSRDLGHYRLTLRYSYTTELVPIA